MLITFKVFKVLHLQYFFPIAVASNYPMVATLGFSATNPQRVSCRESCQEHPPPVQQKHHRRRARFDLPAVDVLVQVNGVFTRNNVVDGRTLSAFGSLGSLGHVLVEKRSKKKKAQRSLMSTGKTAS